MESGTEVGVAVKYIAVDLDHRALLRLRAVAREKLRQWAEECGKALYCWHTTYMPPSDCAEGQFGVSALVKD